MPPSPASSNEWVPVFRAQAAAMNKMAFKAFFITAFSQTQRGSCRASDGLRLGKLHLFDYLSPRNVRNGFGFKRLEGPTGLRAGIIRRVLLRNRTTWWERGVVRLHCGPECQEHGNSTKCCVNDENHSHRMLTLSFYARFVEFLTTPFHGLTELTESQYKLMNSLNVRMWSSFRFCSFIHLSSERFVRSIKVICNILAVLCISVSWTCNISLNQLILHCKYRMNHIFSCRNYTCFKQQWIGDN